MRRYILRFILSLSVLTIVNLSQNSLAAPCEQGVGKTVSVQGTVEVKRVGESEWRSVKLNNTFCPGDTIRIAANSRADVSLANRSVLRLNANTSMTFEQVKDTETSVVEMLKGVIHFFSRGTKSLEVQTPFTTAGVRGTEFLINVDEDKASLSVFEGEVLAKNEAGSLSVTGGQSIIAEMGKAPIPYVVARPRDAVRWALHYPPVIFFRSNEFQTKTGWQGKVRESLSYYSTGDLKKAFGTIEDIQSSGIRDPRFFIYRASLLLSVGNADEANRDIEQALTYDPENADASGLQTIIAVVQNEKEEALRLGRKATAANPESVTTQIALSYALQARFDLEGARASVAKAVQLEPENALAWARLAELRSSFGDLDGAFSAAWRAADLAPDLSRTQTVLGFAYLTQVKTTLAKDAFDAAIALDQADPLPRLGVGLAKIREGNLDEGARDIEIAASLDPNNSLVRSYLGKAYFEEKRTKLSEREYMTAKELDSKDPTPWFYDAIHKQTTNRPIDALRDVQNAIELNDNRAIYRSRLLLDSDLAARSAGLARIYSDLGFQQLALVEGWKSVNTDPGNFSAHRFLADTYAALPRHEIARVSELLQSQLLQPLNLTPIQPRLAESNLFLISSGGPGGLSFNEFNPLFNQDRLALQVSNFVGGNDTSGGEGVVAGVYDKISFSAGYSHFQSDGFRINNDQGDDIANVFVQAELSPSTSVQAEYRYRNTENGDLQLRFFPESIRPNERTEKKTNSYRFGVRHTISPRHVILGSVIYQDVDETVVDHPTPPDGPPEFISTDPTNPFALEVAEPFLTSVDIRRPSDSISGELQYLFRSPKVNIAGGIGHFDVDAEDESNVEFTIPFRIPLPPPPIASGGFISGSRLIPTTRQTDRDRDHTNLYLYSTTNFLEDVALTLGASGDFFDSDSPSTKDKDQFNPKFGITWNPFPTTTLRAAGFRVLKRTLITNQTLEPTQVAGFNQFFDDINGTESWRYGGAIDQRLSEDLFGGFEFSKRDLEVPFLDARDDPLNPVLREVDWKESLARAYLFWTPHDWWALRAEYIYEEFDRDEDFTSGIKEVDTHRLPLGINFFHPCGFSTSFTATYFNQQGEFGEGFDDSIESGRASFWTFDVGITYRLPKRYGLITLGASNLFDKNFDYFDADFGNPIIQPERVLFTRMSLSF